MNRGASYVKSKKSIEDELLRMFAGFPRYQYSTCQKNRVLWHPHCNVFQNDDKMIVIAEIAGVESKDMNITVEEDLLRVSGERRLVCDDNKTIYHNLEINCGSFERNIHIPRAFVGGRVSAKINNGILKIEISKPEKKDINITVE